jgi:hypothetical protein
MGCGHDPFVAGPRPGVQEWTELINLMGCDALLAFNVHAFGAELPAETTGKPLPIEVEGPSLRRRYAMATQMQVQVIEG